MSCARRGRPWYEFAVPFEIEFYEDETDGSPVWRWVTEELSPTQRRALTAVLEEILAVQGLDVCKGEFGKALGGGLFELRIRQDADQILARIGKAPRAQTNEPPAKILLRVFGHAYGTKVILLLGGYDKARRPSSRHQQAEIEIARRRLSAWKRRRG
jgi:hypothetical protein